MKQKKYSSAFTLIEMLLVMTIVALIGIMSFAFLGTSKRDNDLKTAQREVAATIKQAQSYALQGKSVSDGKTPCGFGVHFESTKNYVIFYIPADTTENCDTKNNSNDDRQYLNISDSPSIETNVLKNNVSLQSPINDAEIYFTVPHGNAFGNDGNAYPGSGHDLKIKGPGATIKIITVGPSGSVLEN